MQHLDGSSGEQDVISKMKRWFPARSFLGAGGGGAESKCLNMQIAHLSLHGGGDLGDRLTGQV